MVYYYEPNTKILRFTGWKHVNYIADQESFNNFCTRALEQPVLAIDTEFLREKTYYARLCLLQLATPKEVAIVDPFAIDNLDPLIPLLESPDIVKLFHAGRQDLEILYHETGVLPAPIFDTQVAAALLGHVQQIGYGGLVHNLCGVTLKKADSFTDWARRPLTNSQISYAADDVIYLPQMYAIMRKELKKKRRLHWLDKDFETMSNPESYEVDPYDRYRRLKRVSSLSRKQLNAARELAAWRETDAQEKNIPRKWILTDEQIVEICKREPRTIDELYMVRGVSEKVDVRTGRALLKLIKKALDAPEDAWPEIDRSVKNEPNVDIPLGLMNAVVQLRARENDIAVQTLANSSDLVRIARGYRDDIELLTGWRKRIVGDELVDLVEGRLSLSLDAGGLRIEPTCGFNLRKGERDNKANTASNEA